MMRREKSTPDPDWPQRLKDALARHERIHTPQELSDSSGVNKGTISKYLNGYTKTPSYPIIRSLCKSLDTNVDVVLYGADGSMMLVETKAKPGAGAHEVPVVGIAQMGEDGFWEEWDLPEGGGDEVVPHGSGDPNAYALEVRGDSMHPAIRNGWYVVAEPNRSPEPGEYVIVRTTDGQSMVKELLWWRRGEIALESVNNGYPRLTLREEDVLFVHPVGNIASPAAVRIRS